MNKSIKFRNGSEIIIGVDEVLDIDWDGEWEMMKKVLMPKLNLKEHKIILLETPSKKSGFFYDMWNKNEN